MGLEAFDLSQTNVLESYQIHFRVLENFYENL